MVDGFSMIKVDNRTLEKKLLAISRGEKVTLTPAEKKLIGVAQEALTSQVQATNPDKRISKPN